MSTLGDGMLNDIANVFSTLGKLATGGRKALDELGESACSEAESRGDSGAVEACTGRNCALVAGHDPPCRPVKAVR